MFPYQSSNGHYQLSDPAYPPSHNSSFLLCTSNDRFVQNYPPYPCPPFPLSPQTPTTFPSLPHPAADDPAAAGSTLPACSDASLLPLSSLPPTSVSRRPFLSFMIAAIDAPLPVAVPAGQLPSRPSLPLFPSLSFYPSSSSNTATAPVHGEPPPFQHLLTNLPPPHDLARAELRALAGFTGVAAAAACCAASHGSAQSSRPRPPSPGPSPGPPPRRAVITPTPRYRR